jgi:hypothetical protein
MLNDCWPAASGWSMLDYYACPKPAYYAFSRCAKPLIACLAENGGVLRLHLCNDALEATEVKARLYLYDAVSGAERTLKAWTTEVKGNASEVVFSLNFDTVSAHMKPQTVILCDISSPLGEDRALLIPKRYCDLGIAYGDPVVESETEEEITVRADAFLPCAMVDVPYLLSENCLVLKKGERRCLKKLRAL